MIDFHNHLMPGVDDGATDLAQAVSGLKAMQEEGVRTLVTTPHFQASLTRDPVAFAVRMAELDRGWSALQGLVKSRSQRMHVKRGVEIALDLPDPDLSDRRLRLGGTSFVLVEFSGFMVPPRSPEVLASLAASGVRPILAHPERYPGVMRKEGLIGEWRKAGVYLQVNSGSLLGRYGQKAREAALHLLQQGWVDYLSSDYHARGRPRVRECREMLLQMGGEEQVKLLTEVNPRRMLKDSTPQPVPPLAAPPGWWDWLRAWWF